MALRARLPALAGKLSAMPTGSRASSVLGGASAGELGVEPAISKAARGLYPYCQKYWQAGLLHDRYEDEFPQQEDDEK